MEYVTLNNGFSVPMIGLGTFPLKGDALKQTIEMANDVGYSLYDSAHLYQNEKEIGDCIRNGMLKRKNVVLTSKIQGIQYNGRKRYLYLDRQSVKKTYKHSCMLFGTDSLDLYLLHSPFEMCAKAYLELMELYDDGKVGAIGVSNFDVNQLKKLYDKVGVYPMINQIELHPLNSMKEIVAFCQDNGIQVEAYSPFGRGNLISEIMNDTELNRMAHSYNKTVGQIVLRWIVQQGIIAIPRSSNRQRLKDNLDVFDFALMDSDMKYIDSMNRNKGYGKHFQINRN